MVAPEWLRAHGEPEWPERYDHHFVKQNSPGKERQKKIAETVGRDGLGLLEDVYDNDSCECLRHLPAIETLRRVWVQNFTQVGDAVRWRTASEGIPPSSIFISSPHDLDARYSRKYTSSWIGYKVHVTESCDEDLPHLITNVETSGATTADGEVTPEVHKALEKRGLLPDVHLVDTGYLDASPGEQYADFWRRPCGTDP